MIGILASESKALRADSEQDFGRTAFLDQMDSTISYWPMPPKSSTL